MKPHTEQNKYCANYYGVSCVDGSCPMANREEYEERGYDIVHNCAECYHYKGCEDCYLSSPENRKHLKDCGK